MCGEEQMHKKERKKEKQIVRLTYEKRNSKKNNRKCWQHCRKNDVDSNIDACDLNYKQFYVCTN